MPTVILVDVSLSMCRELAIEGSSSPVSVKALANQGIGVFLDYLSENAKLEYAAFMLFSSLWELRVPFTRDVLSIKSELKGLETFDKTNIVNALGGALSLKLHDWTQNGPVNIIIVTDGQTTNFHTEEHIDSSLKVDDDFADICLDSLKDSFDFPCKIQVVCIASPNEPSLKYAIPFYKELVSIVDPSSKDLKSIINPSLDHSPSSAIWLPECGNSKNLTKDCIQIMFKNLAELHYKPFNATLTCGNISSLVMLHPKPENQYVDETEFGNAASQERGRNRKSYKFGTDITIYGFLPLTEISSPPVLSRHIVIPVTSSKHNETKKAEQILSQDPNAYDKVLPNGNPPSTDGGIAKSQDPSDDDDKHPSFCVLLHSSIKTENSVAICQLGKDDWFGMIHASYESKKKSCLMLSCFKPGPECIPWLPDLRTLGLPSINPKLSSTDMDRDKVDKKSYSSSCVIWLEPESLQSDSSKILRHAKRLPEKNQNFYKELNKYRKAALSYGFIESLHGMANILDRERLAIELSDKPNVNAVAQLAHAAAALREESSIDSYDKNLTPLPI